MLRGQGMIARVDNFEACRDLNGRRIRDVNNEIRLAEWKKKEKTVEEHNEEIKLPKKRPRHQDDSVKNSIRDSIEGTKSALFEGLKKKKIN